MKFRSLFVFLFTFSTILSCNSQPTKNIETIAAETFAKKIKETPKPQILDVRTPEEFDSEHIDNAININWLSNDFATNIKKIDKSKPVFLYCKSGGRSAKAAAKLEELGFKKIYNLEGGMMKWNATGLSKPSDQIIGISRHEYAELLNTDKKVLVDFYAKWCAPCKKMAPYLLKMQKEMADKVVIIRLDADENKTLIKEMKIEELPALLLYENKELKWKNSGFISEENLKKQLQ
ncbi:rhodanese-like domain-containing protein [Flavobacterium franklandianum]|uniref:Redoxin domain-containing protein n=1 Tax=Flavobacterium franklandianum TaxID=2594430 RepID=A0A553CJW7_9FLAO|nr:rhodanese-like domain-containing protein [Flavobacterium franklandianum]TRX20793.1 redoxin domain-containing protein [Flavobacterium franklandianum]